MVESRHSVVSGRLLLQTVVLVLLGTVAYLPAMRGGFIWDDVTIYILDNHLLAEWDGWYTPWVTTLTADYYPLAYSTFWVDWQLWGEDTLGYHVENLLLHLGTAGAIWWTLRLLNVPASWLAALIFTVHPVNVETVAWISQRKSLLAALFGFVALGAFIQFKRSSRKRWYVLALFAFLLSLAGKPSLITLPVVLLLLAWWQRGRIARSDVLWAAPFFLLSAAFGVIGVWFQSQQVLMDTVVREQNLAARLVTATWCVWFYLGKALLPWNLSFVYPRWEMNMASPLTYLPAVALAVLVGVLLWKRNSWGRTFLFALGFYLITLLPALGLVDVYFWRYSYVADHYQYQSIIAVIALVCGGMARMISRKNIPRRNVWPAAAAVGVVAVLCVLTWRQATAYASEETLWRDTLAKNPQAWMAHNNLANLLLQRGDFGEAAEHYQAALEIDPTAIEPLLSLARMQAQQGEHDQAIELLLMSQSKLADTGDVRLALAEVLADAGRMEEAKKYCEEAIRTLPNAARAHVVMANILADEGDLNGAKQHFLKSLSLDPGQAAAHQGLRNLMFGTSPDPAPEPGDAPN